MAALSTIPLILVVLAMLVLVRGQQRAAQRQAEALREFIEGIKEIGR